MTMWTWKNGRVLETSAFNCCFFSFFIGFICFKTFSFLFLDINFDCQHSHTLWGQVSLPGYGQVQWPRERAVMANTTASSHLLFVAWVTHGPPQRLVGVMHSCGPTDLAGV